ncbi:RING finger protein 145-like [Saccostrea echinata]|uniref:RING finger protein 145-like n=1 Tax=Saccostrea echinata TaxID=191078 RepID=UPI002A7FF166|nr:RING finger protein 145-like [Saccostrea echinata]
MVVPYSIIRQLYWFFLRAFPVVFAYSYAVDFMESKFQDKDFLSMEIFRDIGVLYVTGLFSDYLFGEKCWTKVFLVAYTLPLLIRQLGLPITINNIVHYMATEAIFYYLIIKLIHIILVATNLLNVWENILDNFRFSAFLNIIASDIRFSKQLLVYWSLLFLYQLFCNLSAVKEMDWPTLFFVSVGECCTTPLGVIAMCKSVLYAYQYFIALTNAFIHGLDTYGKFNYNVTWAHGFFILAMYIRSGFLPSAEHLESPFKGAFRMKIVLLSTVLFFLNLTYCNTHPVIISFSVAPKTKPFKHIRGLLTYIFIILFCALTMTMIYKLSDVSETINILSLCLSTCVQAMSSFIIYIIYVYDGIYSKPWESMDDVVFYIWSTIQLINTVLSFVLACTSDFFLFQNYFYWLSPLLLVGCLPFWERLKMLWKNLQVRRKTMKMIDLLPNTTEEQIQDFDDVCSICQYSISTAKITPCGHFFHQMCLKKWMYTNDLCPLCRQSVSSDSPSKSEMNNESDVHSESGFHSEFEAFNESSNHSESNSEDESSINSEPNSLDESDTPSESDSLD